MLEILEHFSKIVTSSLKNNPSWENIKPKNLKVWGFQLQNNIILSKVCAAGGGFYNNDITSATCKNHTWQKSHRITGSFYI